MVKKIYYETPEVEVITLIPEGVIADSTKFTVPDPFGGTGESDWGNS